MAFRISNETRIGLFATIALMLLILGYNFLLGNDVFTRQNVFYAKYAQVEGLASANPVKVKGMSVGRVVSMTYVPDRDYVVVKLKVNADIDIPVGSTAEIVSQDLLGSKAINIDFTKNATKHKNNDTLASSIQESLTSSVRAEIAPVKEKAENLLASIDSVMTAIHTVLTPETQRRLVASINSIQSTLENVDNSSENLDKLLKNNTSRMEHIFANIESITNNLKNNEQQISTMIQNVSAITDSVRRANITQTFNMAKATLEQTQGVLQKINAGEGSLGLLVNDKKLYNNLDSASKSLDALLIDMKQHPNRYIQFSVFGKKEKAPTQDTNP